MAFNKKAPTVYAGLANALEIPDGWEWTDHVWSVDRSSACDAHGWEYSFDFHKHSWHPQKKTRYFVRRRKFTRARNRILDVQGMHFERSQANHETGPDKSVLTVVVAQNVADVLAKVAFYAFAKLLHSFHVTLHHAVIAVGILLLGLKGLDALVLLEIPRDVSD